MIGIESHAPRDRYLPYRGTHLCQRARKTTAGFSPSPLPCTLPSVPKPAPTHPRHRRRKRYSIGFLVTSASASSTDSVPARESETSTWAGQLGRSAYLQAPFVISGNGQYVHSGSPREGECPSRASSYEGAAGAMGAPMGGIAGDDCGRDFRRSDRLNAFATSHLPLTAAHSDPWGSLDELAIRNAPLTFPRRLSACAGYAEYPFEILETSVAQGLVATIEGYAESGSRDTFFLQLDDGVLTRTVIPGEGSCAVKSLPILPANHEPR